MVNRKFVRTKKRKNQEGKQTHLFGSKVGRMNDHRQYLGYPKYRLRTSRDGTTRLIKNVMDYSSVERKDLMIMTSDEMDEWANEFRKVERKISVWKWIQYCGVTKEAHEALRTPFNSRTAGKYRMCRYVSFGNSTETLTMT